MGWNSRLDALQAVVLEVKLRRLEGWTEGRRANARYYDETFADLDGLTTPRAAGGGRHIYNQYVVRTERRDELQASLARALRHRLLQIAVDRIKEALQVVGTQDPDHPGADYLLHHSGPFYLGGSLEVISTNEEAMMDEALSIFETFNPVAENVVVKVPVNPRMPDSGEDAYAGLKVLKKLYDENIPTNCTLVMTPEQALLAAAGVVESGEDRKGGGSAEGER